MHDAEHTTPPLPRSHLRRDGELHAELIVTGDDLLCGDVGDSSAQAVASLLTRRGARVDRITVIADAVDAISAAIRESLARRLHFLVTIGGLGPGANDRTIAALSNALDLPLRADSVAREQVDRAFAALKEQRRVEHGGINAARDKMTQLPVGCTILPNASGVAPGTLCRLPGSTAIISVPGTPREARSVFEEALPHLNDFGRGRISARREIEAPVPDESALVPLLEELGAEYPDAIFWTRPAGSEKKGFRLMISIEVRAETIEEAESAIGLIVRRLLALAAGSK